MGVLFWSLAGWFGVTPMDWTPPNLMYMRPRILNNSLLDCDTPIILLCLMRLTTILDGLFSCFFFLVNSSMFGGEIMLNPMFFSNDWWCFMVCFFKIMWNVWWWKSWSKSWSKSCWIGLKQTSAFFNQRTVRRMPWGLCSADHSHHPSILDEMWKSWFETDWTMIF